MSGSAASPQSPIFPHLQGFQPLPASSGRAMAANNPQHLEDIPLERVITGGSVTGARKGTSTTGVTTAVGSDNEKSFRPTLGRRKTGSDLGGPGRSSEPEDGTLTRMGRIYSKILGASVITRYFIYVSPLAICIAIPIIIGATVAPHAYIGGVKMVWFFTWIEIVWLSLWVSKIFAHFVPGVVQFLAGVVSPGVKKYALIIRALEIPLSLVGWALASLLTFTPLMLRNPDTEERAKTQPSLKSLQNWQTVLRQILAATLVCTIIFFAERFLIQVIGINYHRKQFDEKIKDNKRSIYLVGLLYDASRAIFPEYCTEFAEEDYIINDALNLSSLNGKKGSGTAAPMRLLHNVGRFGDKVGSAFGTMAQEITGKKVFDLSSGHSIVIEALERTRACEALAKRLWMSFVMEGREELFQEDIVEVLGADRRAEAEECFAALDRDGNGDVSLDEITLTITDLGRTRKAIASSMHDVDQALSVLDGLLATVVLIISIFVFVAFLNKSFSTTLTTAGTALLSLSFVFAATCQEVLGSCIFLFVKHPFDIGDRVDVSTDQLVVERISLLYTIFKRVATGKTVQVPNIVLNNLWVDNITRSKAMREQIPIFVNFETSFEDIQTLKSEMEKFITDKENSRDFQPDVDIEVIGIAELNKMELRIEIKHKSNWSNESVRAARRSKFMCALVLALRRVPIYAPGAGDAALGSADSPSFSVSVDPETAYASKKSFAKSKDAKRLYPKTIAPAPASAAGPFASGNDFRGANSEYQAVQNITSRNPAVDNTRDETWNNRDDMSTLGDRTVPDHDRPSLEESQNLLGREASRGQRKPKQGLQSQDELLPPRGPSTVAYAQPPNLNPGLSMGAMPPSFDGPSGYPLPGVLPNRGAPAPR